MEHRKTLLYSFLLCWTLSLTRVYTLTHRYTHTQSKSTLEDITQLKGLVQADSRINTEKQRRKVWILVKLEEQFEVAL